MNSPLLKRRLNRDVVRNPGQTESSRQISYQRPTSAELSAVREKIDWLRFALIKKNYFLMVWNLRIQPNVCTVIRRVSLHGEDLGDWSRIGIAGGA
ncbi:MAG: hypothetical protein V7K27_04785 [Nostoc sp.]|uniref:hypothetical protein n=1 Tax=Nostoc sp. TaxID=1180 RepID=UPI002FF45BF3